MIGGDRLKPQIPESVAEATDSLRSLVARDSGASLEDLQGAIEYLLDKVKAARGLKGSMMITSVETSQRWEIAWHTLPERPVCRHHKKRHGQIPTSELYRAKT